MRHACSDDALRIVGVDGVSLTCAQPEIDFSINIVYVPFMIRTSMIVFPSIKFVKCVSEDGRFSLTNWSFSLTVTRF